jgi:hypothetical protein
MKRVEAKLDDKTYKKFAKYCKDNGLFINAAIKNLIINQIKNK